MSEFRQFIVKHQYKVLPASIIMGLMWAGICHLLAAWWFFWRLSLLLAIISFVPAGLILLAHGRSFMGFYWWNKSNDVFTTRRSPKLEKVELIVMSVLWAAIFIAVVIAIFWNK